MRRLKFKVGIGTRKRKKIGFCHVVEFSVQE